MDSSKAEAKEMAHAIARRVAGAEQAVPVAEDSTSRPQPMTREQLEVRRQGKQGPQQPQNTRAATLEMVSLLEEINHTLSEIKQALMVK